MSACFVWFKIERKHRPLIHESNKTIHGNQQLLSHEGRQLIRNNRMCVDKRTGNLRLFYFDPKSSIGTYYCRHKNDKNHPVNFIWYHIDTIVRPTDKLVSRKIEDIEVSSRHLEETVEKVKTKLNGDDLAWPKYKSLPWTILPKFDIQRIPSSLSSQSCKDKVTKVRVVRRCYVKLNDEKNVEEFSNSETDLQYKLLKQAFRFLLEKESSSPKSKTGDFVGVAEPLRLSPDYLGFQDPNIDHLNSDERIIEFPCHFTFFRHLNGDSNPYEKLNLYTEIHIKDSCKEVNPEDIMDLVNSGDTDTLRDLILEASPVLPKHVTNIYLEGMQKKSIACSTPLKNVNCVDGNFQSVIWRKNDATIFPRSAFQKEYLSQVIVDYFFEKILQNDSGVYSCFIHSYKQLDSSEDDQKISSKSHLEKSIEFKVIVKPASRFSVTLPDLNSMKRHAVILMMWTAFVFIMWLYLLVIRPRLKHLAEIKMTAFHLSSNSTSSKLLILFAA